MGFQCERGGASNVSPSSKQLAQLHAIAFVEKKKMEELKSKNKGGRPKKAVKRDEQLAVMCNTVERKLIEIKAGKANLTKSEFLRLMGLEGKVFVKEYPKEILKFIGVMNHIAANLNSISKKRNYNEVLNENERVQLHELSINIQQLIEQIRRIIV